LAAVSHAVLPLMTARRPVTAWIVDDTGFPKKGRHSVGVARQYCGQLGKQDNCQVAASLSVATAEASLPIAWRLYLPQDWAADAARRAEAKVPKTVTFQSKGEIALEQISQALSAEVPAGTVLADAGYGNSSAFRDGLTALGLEYSVGVLGTTVVWPPGLTPRVPARRAGGRGQHPKRLRQGGDNAAVVQVRALAADLPPEAWRTVSWRSGVAEMLSSRFAALRVRPAHGDHRRSEPRPELWLLVEWPKDENAPSKFWLSTLPEDMALETLVERTMQRWRIERDYLELKQELGLGHYEGRGWRGFHHHGALCIAAYGFLVAERAAIPPSATGHARLVQAPALPDGHRPRGAPDTYRTPRAALDRDTQTPDHPRLGQKATTMPMLQPAESKSQNRSTRVMTQ